MLRILLVIIYLSFISLGLPDAILGSAWPDMSTDLNVEISFAGIPTLVLTAGTIISSLFSEKLIRKYKTGKVTAFSVLLTAVSLLGMYFSPNFIWICLLSIPLGIGGGAVDAALNNFVSLHYELKHMNWLHCFWGIGATAGPMVMSLYLLKENGWRLGYLSIGVIQVILAICIFATLPLWNKLENKDTDYDCNKNDENIDVNNVSDVSDVGVGSVMKLSHTKPILLAFFSYCAIESLAGIWASSYLVVNNNLSIAEAAKWVSVYYLGITFGRFIAGFISMKFNNKQMIRMGQVICLMGVILFILPFGNIFKLSGLLFIGLGCAPIYPAMLHETPNRFTKELSQRMMGIQMATAYIGSALIPPLFGVISNYMGLGILPYFLLILVIMMLVSSEMTNKIIENNEKIVNN